MLNLTCTHLIMLALASGSPASDTRDVSSAGASVSAPPSIAAGCAAIDFGFADTIQTIVGSPKARREDGLGWSVGPAILYLTAASRHTVGNKWELGQSIIVLKKKGPITVGAVASRVWSVEASGDRQRLRATTFQPFLSYTTKRAFTYTLKTESTYDWETGKWIVPIGVSVSQLVRIGEQPASIGAGVRYYAARPKWGPDWRVRVVAALPIPNK